ncbi:MAG: hypothetical protein ISR65_01205 [Bacteriovoracaceae bacterium]|nr:hypothetical protein [Bacteriovoracaceae bacterium]
MPINSEEIDRSQSHNSTKNLHLVAKDSVQMPLAPHNKQVAFSKCTLHSTNAQSAPPY